MESLASRLQKLREDQNLSEKELSSLTGVSQPTLNRILNGSTANLHRKTMRALAHFFNISLNETIASNKSTNVMKSQPSTLVPVFELGSLNKQLNLLNKNKTDSFEYLHILAKIDGPVFALIAKDQSLEPRFPQGSNLIFKLNASFKNRDYVLIDAGNEFVIKQFLVDGNSKYLKSLVSELNYPIYPLDQKEKIIAVLAQAIVNYTELA